MPGLTSDHIRIPIALVLLVLAGFVLLPRGDASEQVADQASPTPTIILGTPGGEVVSSDDAAQATPTPAPEATPLVTPEPTSVPTPEPTPPPVTADGFAAEVLACSSISGDSCNGQLGTLPAGAGSFTALVRFTGANGGDTLNAILSGPAGTIPGGAYTLQGGGRGYYYTTFTADVLPAGNYTLIATRNGQQVASTAFAVGG
jgi:hypothetical protein